MMREIQQSIWEHFAVKRRHFYLAGFFIGAFGALIAAMHHAEHGFPLWSLPVGGALGRRSVVAFVCRETSSSHSSGSCGG